eukprot:3844767-Rhodomonas_salina.2
MGMFVLSCSNARCVGAVVRDSARLSVLDVGLSDLVEDLRLPCSRQTHETHETHEKHNNNTPQTHTNTHTAHRTTQNNTGQNTERTEDRGQRARASA